MRWPCTRVWPVNPRRCRPQGRARRWRARCRTATGRPGSCPATQLLPQLIQTVNDDAASARVMAAIIGQDPVLTGNLLRIANSPAYKVHERPVEACSGR